MSSDTSILIAKFPDGRHYTDVIQAAGNLQPYWYDTDKEWRKAVRSYDWSKPFKTRTGCVKSAKKLESDYEDADMLGLPVEYGICDVGEFDFNP